MRTTKLKNQCIYCKELKDEHEFCSRRLSVVYCKEFHILSADKYKTVTHRSPRLCAKCLRRFAVRNNKKRQLQKAKYRISRNISTGIRKSLKTDKGGKWETLVGCTISDLRQHLEKQFQPGMTWNNYGRWHIHHIRAITLFNFTRPESKDFKRCWALSNLQPLWATDNWHKSKSSHEGVSLKNSKCERLLQ